MFRLGYIKLRLIKQYMKCDFNCLYRNKNKIKIFSLLIRKTWK